MREYYVPGVGEKDTDKIIRSLGQAHENSAADADDIATNAADIATNTADIATNTADIATNTASISSLASRRAPDAIIEDQKSNGVAGGGLTSGVNTRALNTLVRNLAVFGVNSLSSNQFELSTGSFYIQWSAPAWRTDQHQTILRNVTDGSYPAFGTSEYSPSAIDGPQTRSSGSTVVTIAATKSFALHHYVLTTKASNGAGLATSVGGNECYARVEIWRLA